MKRPILALAIVAVAALIGMTLGTAEPEVDEAYGDVPDIGPLIERANAVHRGLIDAEAKCRAWPPSECAPAWRE